MGLTHNLMYVKAAGILLLLSLLSAGIWKLYDAGGDAREAKIMAEQLLKENKVQQEILRLKTLSENQIVKDRIIYRDRIHKIREVVVDCKLPDDLIVLLRQSGIFTGSEVRNPLDP